ncbi:hypothetical protein QJQ45_012109 [Haematococcus lacustris]|nr:hypothetical protein QJQ45_012109 [Haematococcus lacustris]
MCSTSTGPRFYDRDVSASLNIRRIAAGPGHPHELSSWVGRPAMPTQAVWARSTIPELAVPAGAPPQQQQQLAAASTSRKREAPAANKSRAAKQGASNNGVAKRASVARLA